MLKALPDTVPMDPKHIAEVVSAAVDKAPKPESFISAPSAAEPAQKNITQPDSSTQEVTSSKGFMVTDETPDEETEE